MAGAKRGRKNRNRGRMQNRGNPGEHPDCRENLKRKADGVGAEPSAVRTGSMVRFWA